MRLLQTYSTFYITIQHIASFVPITTATITEFWLSRRSRTAVLCESHSSIYFRRIPSFGECSGLVLGAIFIQALVISAFFPDFHPHHVVISNLDYCICQNIDDLPCRMYALSFKSSHAVISSLSKLIQFILGTKWLLPQLMLIYNSQINPQTCTQTPTDYSLCLRVFQRQELHADLWVSDGCCCDSQWIFWSPNTHPTSGWVTACWRPESLTVPTSSNTEPQCPCRCPRGKCYYNIRKSPPLTCPKAPKKTYHAAVAVCFICKKNLRKKKGPGMVWRANAATSSHSWDIRRAF